MKQDVKLYINDKEVEFTQPFDIFYNFKITDITHPTAIKNTFTRNITLDDTQINNDIFSNVWNVEKINNSINNNFNPNKKVPFVLYVNSEIYEKGYVKLNAIKKVNNRYKYDITMFGGLGQYFYNLSTVEDKQKSLADLIYTDKNNRELDLSFTINKETIFDAWNSLIGNTNGYIDEANVNRPSSYLYDSKWNTINFMVGYDGKPNNNFNTDKVLINSKDYDLITDNFNSTYKDVNGYVLGTTNEELTMNMAQDYRSYLLRPVIKFKNIINACQNPKNNGGWELKLDESFFNNSNPYYNDAWLTLNRLIDNEKEEEDVTEIVNGSLTKEGEDYTVNFSKEDLFKYTNAKIEVTLNLTSNSTENELYTNYVYTNNAKKPKYKEYIYNGAILMQALAYNEFGELVIASNTHYIGSNVNSTQVTRESYFNSYKDKWEESGLPTNEVIYNIGKYVKTTGNKYKWVNEDNTNVFVFEFPNDVKFDKVVIRTLRCNTTAINTKRWYVSGGYEWDTKIRYNDYDYYWKTPKVISTNKNITVGEIESLGGKSNGTAILELIKLYIMEKRYKNFFSNTKIKVEDYLTTEYTPADYLINYAKMFGLYFYTNPQEVPSDVTKYPKGVIHLMTRDTFFNTDKVVDLTDVVDRGREYEITPYVLDKKYYTFEVPQIESEVELEYNKKYATSYGSKKYETSFEFNNETEELLDSTIFKSGIDVLEVDKYFTQRDENDLPAYYYNGFSFEIFQREGGDFNTDKIDVPIVKKELPNINNINLKFGDSFAKVQFHGNNNESLDECNNILVFFNGSSLVDDNNTPYFITDDIDEMYTLNGETPCYILTKTETDINGNYIAYKIKDIPKFQRTKVDYNGNILYSFDMGKVKMTYVKDNYITENSSITSNVWDKYMNDLKNENNKKMKCYLNFKEQATPQILRNLYWYENSFWILNEVNNWNINKLEPTECELVKVIDRDNYKTTKINYTQKIIFKLEGFVPNTIDNRDVNQTIYKYNISKDLIKLNVVIYSENNEFEWWFGDYFYRKDFETGRTEEEPFSYYTTAEQYNVGSSKPDIRLPYSEYKQIYDIPIFTDNGYIFIAQIETDGKLAI